MNERPLSLHQLSLIVNSENHYTPNIQMKAKELDYELEFILAQFEILSLLPIIIVIRTTFLKEFVARAFLILNSQMDSLIY